MAQGNGPIYVFDTSAWIKCDELAGDNRIPSILDALHEQRRIKSPKQVFAELERPGCRTEWIKKRQQKLAFPRGLPADFSKVVGMVQHRFPSMGGAFSKKERADPYIVATAFHYTSDEQEWVVVCAETPNNRPNRKIPGACKELGVRCITVSQLMTIEGPG